MAFRCKLLGNFSRSKLLFVEVQAQQPFFCYERAYRPLVKAIFEAPKCLWKSFCQASKPVSTKTLLLNDNYRRQGSECFLQLSPNNRPESQALNIPQKQGLH